MPAQLRGKVLFISDRDGERRTLAVDPANGRQAYVSVPWPYRLAERTQLSSPDGRYSLTVDFDDNGKSQIFSRDSATGVRTKLTSFRTGAFEPAWSPGGNRIAFGSWESGNEEIYTMDPDGSNIVQLTNHGDIDRHPTWSPDGTRIAFWSQRDTGRRQLWVMNADGSNPRRLLATSSDDYDPFWAR
jgi:Tol biopolymer transport system component